MSWLYAVTIYPLELIYRYLYIAGANLTGSYGVGLLILSLCSFLAFIPLKRLAASAERDERELQAILKPQIDRISKECSGTERHERISRLYKRYAYHPVMAIRSTFGVFLQLPFLLAAYHMIGGLSALRGESFFFLSDLSRPDGLLNGINLLPIAMTLVNFATTFTSEDMRFRERAQAVVIALLFLLLLYNAPSALLFFWTCNNLLFFGESLWGRVWKKLASFMQNRVFLLVTLAVSSFSTEILLVISLGATLFVFVPIDLYMSNISEFWFPLHSIMGGVISTFLIFSLLLLLILRVLGGKLRNMMTSLLFALTVGFFLQSNFLNVYYGVLDGTPIPWEKFGTVAVVNTSIWGALLIAPFLLMRLLKSTLYRKLVAHTVALLLGIQMLFMLLSLGAAPLPVKGNYYLSTEKMFELSSKNNIIVFVLDNFDTELFQVLLKKYPELAEPLNGFTYFPDAVGSYPTTKGALPQILTGVWYENRETFAEYIEKAWRNNPFWNFLKNNGFDNRIFTISDFVYYASENIDNIVKTNLEISSIWDLLTNFYKLSAFRFMPHISKKYFSFYFENFNIYAKPTGNANAPEYRQDDVNFYKQMIANGFTITDKFNSFRFYHLWGAHPPYNMNRSIGRVALGKVLEEEQAAGSLNIVFAFIKLLKQKNIFNNTAIIVIADHGNSSRMLTRPLVLFKPKFSESPLLYSANPISFADLQPTLIKTIKGFQYGKSFFVKKDPNYKRRFMYYSWDASWKDDYLPYMQEYIVMGNSSYLKSWTKTGFIYAPKGDVKFKEPYSYEMGQSVNFGLSGNSAEFCRFGWSAQEEKYRWTEGSQVGLSFHLQEGNAERNILLRLKASAYLGGGLPQQEIRVFANEKRIATWQMKGLSWYEAVIPAGLIGEKGMLNIVFAIGAPTAPSDVGASKDARKLGISARELVMETYVPRNLYSLGSIVAFSGEGKNSVYLADGWSHQEERHRWTEGYQAGLSFRLQGSDAKKDILLRLKASAYLGGGRTHQEIGVFANGKRVATWQMKDLNWYEAVIPAGLIDETGLLSIVFALSAPIAPSEVGESKDTRKLGIAARELILRNR